jgi:hypothetical protein
VSVAVQERGCQLGQRGDVAVLGDVGRVLAEPVAQQPGDGDRAGEHRRERRAVPLGSLGVGLGGEPAGGGVVHALNVVAHRGRQVGEAVQVAE